MHELNEMQNTVHEYRKALDAFSKRTGQATASSRRASATPTKSTSHTLRTAPPLAPVWSTVPAPQPPPRRQQRPGRPGSTP